MISDQLTDSEVAHGRFDYEDTYDDVRRTFADIDAKVIRDMVPETLPLAAPEKVAYLHIDMNSAAAEEAALEWYWPKLVMGAIVIGDDYGFSGFEDQHSAWDAFAERKGTSVLSLPTGQGMLVKP